MSSITTAVAADYPFAAMGPVGQRMPESSFRYDGRTMVRYQGHLQIELLLSFMTYPQSLSGAYPGRFSSMPAGC